MRISRTTVRRLVENNEFELEYKNGLDMKLKFLSRKVGDTLFLDVTLMNSKTNYEIYPRTHYKTKIRIHKKTNYDKIGCKLTKKINKMLKAETLCYYEKGE